MDSRLKQTAILIASFMVLAVLVVVFIVNKDTTSKRQAAQAALTSTEPVEPIVEVVTTGNLKQIGNDLNGWKKDETFFDEVKDETLASLLSSMHSSKDESATTLNRTNPEDDPDNYKVDVSGDKQDTSSNEVSQNDQKKETKPKKDGSNGYG